MRRFYQATHKADTNYEFLAISVDEDRDAAVTAAKHDKMPFPVLFDSAGKTAAAYGVQAIPTLLVVDEKGMVNWGQTGFQSATEILLAMQLGIKNYTPKFGPDTDAAAH